MSIDYPPTYPLINTIQISNFKVDCSISDTDPQSSTNTTHYPSTHSHPYIFRLLQLECNPVHKATGRTEMYL